MTRIAVVTDSNSGITQAQGEKLGVRVLPMPFYIDEKLYFEDITLSQEEFYRRLREDAEIHTSQPAPQDVTDLWDALLKEHDEIVYIPMSSGLSAACQTAAMLARDYDGRVQVVDNQRISVPLYQSVLDALELVRRGRSAKEIREILEAEGKKSSIYITLETLKYLKKGGRITPAAAAIGTVLNLKPVLQIQGERLDAFAKVRGRKNARRTIINALRADMETRFAAETAAGRVHLQAAYTGDAQEAEDWKAELEEAFPGMPVTMKPLSLSVSCHIGPGALGAAVTAMLPEEA